MKAQAKFEVSPDFKRPVPLKPRPNDAYKRGDKVKVYEPSGSNWVEGKIVRFLDDTGAIVSIAGDSLYVDFSRLEPLEG